MLGTCKAKSAVETQGFPLCGGAYEPDVFPALNVVKGSFPALNMVKGRQTWWKCFWYNESLVLVALLRYFE